MLLAASRHRQEKVSLGTKGFPRARTRLLHDGPKVCTSVHAHCHLFRLGLISELLPRKAIAVRVFPLRFNILKSTNLQQSTDFERQGKCQQLALTVEVWA
jgi:hypothetical protein